MRLIKFRAWNGNTMSPHESLGWGIFDHPDYKVMQCSGLKDKHGTLMYEGDLVKIHEHTVGVVEWCEALAFFEIIVRVGDERGSTTLYCHQDENQYNIHREVIGNIYTTPELNPFTDEIQKAS